MEKTRDYDMFIFREDNRASINQNHVQKLYDSIKSRNLLELRPITVNEKFEVLDGQHRLIAARKLGVEIFYKVEKSLGVQDMLSLNNNKSWGLPDYLNFFVRNGYEEYIKLDNFAKQNNLSLRTAYSFTCARGNSSVSIFKKGEYKFVNDVYSSELSTCWSVIEYIKRMNGSSTSAYLKTTKFWNALVKLIRSTNFNEEKFMANLSKMVEKCNVKATSEGYCKMFQEINNWRNNLKVSLLEEDYS